MAQTYSWEGQFSGVPHMPPAGTPDDVVDKDQVFFHDNHVIAGRIRWGSMSFILDYYVPGNGFNGWVAVASYPTRADAMEALLGAD